MDALLSLPRELLVAEVLLKYCTARDVRHLVSTSKAWWESLAEEEYLWKVLFERRNHLPPPPRFVGTMKDLYFRSLRQQVLLVVNVHQTGIGTTPRSAPLHITLPQHSPIFALKKKVRLAQWNLQSEWVEDFELLASCEAEEEETVLGVAGNDFLPSTDELQALVILCERIGLNPDRLLGDAPEQPVHPGWEDTIAHLRDGTELFQIQIDCERNLGGEGLLSLLPSHLNWYLIQFYRAVFRKRFALDVLLIRPLLTSGLFLTSHRLCKHLISYERHIAPMFMRKVDLKFMMDFARDVIQAGCLAALPAIRACLRIELTRVILRLALTSWDVDFSLERVWLNGLQIVLAMPGMAFQRRKLDALLYAVSSLAFWLVMQAGKQQRVAQFLHGANAAVVLPQTLYSIPAAYCFFVLYLAVENFKAQFELKPR